MVQATTIQAHYFKKEEKAEFQMLAKELLIAKQKKLREWRRRMGYDAASRE
jgi:hypothetical protein